MTPAARLAAAIEILDTYLAGGPAEKALTNWARRSRFAGSKDRAAIRDIVYDCLRCRSSFAANGGAQTGRGLALGYLRAKSRDPNMFFTGEGYAPLTLTKEERDFQPHTMPQHVALDIPEWLGDDLQQMLGPQYSDVLSNLQKRAPVYLRVNLSKATLSDVMNILGQDGIESRPCAEVPTALEIIKNERKLRQSKVLQDGLAELQDITSQAVCAAIPLGPGDRILDYCAGGGGKSLALADRLHGTIFAHDISAARMKDLPIRAKRAGVTINTLSTSQLSDHAPYDVVVCDVPCSGSGAWRRSPEGKWSLDRSALEDLLQRQAEILDHAATFTAPDSTLIYITCSIIGHENERQIDEFLSRYSTWKCVKSKTCLPSGNGDGFYYAHLTQGNSDI